MPVRIRWIVIPVLCVGIAAAALWSIPAEEFIFAPDRAKPLADRVKVEGAKPAGKGDVYYVDVFVRRTTLLEQLLPFTRPEGSTILPERALLPPGVSEEERNRQSAIEMRQSEIIASAVALRALGFDVEARPKGAIVNSVAADVPAAGKLRVGDIIIAVDDRPVQTPDELRREIGRHEPGDDVRLTVRRAGKVLELTIGTVPHPTEPSRPIIGIEVTQHANIRLPIEVDIDLGRVGGPSAGLPFALEIARMLGRNVTHGCEVAATGALAIDGSVLTVGGLKQKTIGARRAGVDLFVVPSGENAEEAQDSAGDMKILPVESFQQALRQLTTSAIKC